MFLKLLAFGAAYFQSWRNILDFVLSLATFVYCFVALLVVVLSLTNLYKYVNDINTMPVASNIVFHFIRYLILLLVLQY